MLIISNCYAIHHVSNFASSCRVADLQVRNVPWSECTHYLVHTSLVFGHYYLEYDCVNGSTVVPVMNGHPRDQAKVSVPDRWPLIAGTGGRRQT